MKNFAKNVHIETQLVPTFKTVNCPGKNLTEISARFLIEIWMSVAVITHEILVRFLFDCVRHVFRHNQIRISQISHE